MSQLDPQEILANRYVILDRVGTGGFAEVYSAFDSLWARQVAVKVLNAERLEDGAAAREFVQEARSQARLADHPAVVRIYDAGETLRKREPLPFCVMEWLAGGSLEARLRRARAGRTPLDPRQVLRWLIPVAGALARAAELGILHRDVKPGNILLDGEERAKLGDFGLAREIHAGGDLNSARGAGTLQFMAPEQFRSRARITPGTDVFALGCTLWYLLRDEVPFPAGSAVLLAGDEPAPRLADAWPECPPALDRLMVRMLAVEPDHRPPAAEVQEALGAILRGLERPRWTDPDEETELPARAVLGLGSPRSIYGGSITAVSFGPGTRRALSGGEDHLVRYWDLETGAELGTMPALHAPISALAAAGDLALAGSWEGSIAVWEPEGGREVACLRGHGAAVTRLAVSPDGRSALSAGDDGTLRAWDLETRREVGCVELAGGECHWLGAADDAWRALVRAPDGRLRFRDLRTASEQVCPGGRAGAVLAVAAAGDRVLRGDPDGTMALVRLADGEVIHRMTAPAAAGALRFALTREGSYAVSVGPDGHLRLWDLGRGMEVSAARNRFGPYCVALSADDQWVLAGNRNNTLCLYPLSGLLDDSTR